MFVVNSVDVWPLVPLVVLYATLLLTLPHETFAER